MAISNPLNDDFRQFRLAYDDYLDSRYLLKSAADSLGGGGNFTNPVTEKLTLAGGAHCSSIISGSPTVTGNPHFTGNPSFENDVVFYGSGNDTIKIDMKQDSINAASIKAVMNDASINASNATIDGSPTFKDHPKFNGNPVFSGYPKFNGRVYFHTQEIDDETTPVNDGALIFLQDSTVNAARALMKGNGASITGNPTFTGNPHFTNRANFSDASIQAGNATIHGGVTFNGTPTFARNPVFNIQDKKIIVSDLNGNNFYIILKKEKKYRFNYIGIVSPTDIDFQGDLSSFRYDQIADSSFQNPEPLDVIKVIFPSSPSDSPSDSSSDSSSDSYSDSYSGEEDWDSNWNESWSGGEYYFFYNKVNYIWLNLSECNFYVRDENNLPALTFIGEFDIYADLVNHGTRTVGEIGELYSRACSGIYEYYMYYNNDWRLFYTTTNEWGG